MYIFNKEAYCDIRRMEDCGVVFAVNRYSFHQTVGSCYHTMRVKDGPCTKIPMARGIYINPDLKSEVV